MRDRPRRAAVHVSTARRPEIEIPRWPGRPGAPARTLAPAPAPAPDTFVAAGALPAPAATMVRTAARAAVHRIRLIPYSTVTVLARLRGWSTLRPRATASSYASSCIGTT